MSATQTLLKPQEKQASLSHIFPNEIVSEQKSALFVKKLLAVAISNITYLRGIFPETAYGDRCLEELKLKILKDDSSCPNACQVIQWLKGCFDAIDKKFLRILIIGIYKDPDNPETVIESYTFKFSYTDGGVDIYRNSEKLSSANTIAETKKATRQLLMTILVLFQTLKPLPDDVMVTMKLLYYDDITPSDYEPPGFIASECDNFVYEDKPLNFKVGGVKTPFHTVQLKVKTDSRQFEGNDAKSLSSQMDSETCEDVGKTVNDTKSNTKDLEATSCYAGGKGSKTKLSKKKEFEEQVVPMTLEEPKIGDSVPEEMIINEPEEQAVDNTGSCSQKIDDNGVRCGCGNNEDDGLMILCANCHFWQHGVCYRVLEDTDAPQRHICELCAKDNDSQLEATDSSLNGISVFAVQATCLWRRTLLFCTDIDKIVVPIVAKHLSIEMPIAEGLMDRLEKEEFIKSHGRKLGKTVNKEKLQLGIKKYLKKQDVNSSKQDIDELTKKTEVLYVDDDETSLKAVQDENISVKQGGERRPLKRKCKDTKQLQELNVIADDNIASQDSCQGNDNRKRRKKCSDAAKPLRI